MDYAVIFINIAVSLILIAGIGLVLLGLPGNILIFITALGYGYYDNFIHISWAVLSVLFVALAAGEIVEFLAGALGAKKEKASSRAVIAAFFGAFSGGIAGTAILPLIGSFLGAMLGAFAASFLAEYSKTSDRGKAGRVALSVMKGQIIGTIVKVIIAVGMAVAIIYRLSWQ